MGRLQAVEGRSFDVIVIGGGIVGAGIARDAVLRGLRVALFEKGDYGGGTTAASTRIVHGGLRYLEQYDFRLVRLDLRERETLLGIAPHLVKPLEFLVPHYGRSRWSRARLRAGLALYDVLSFDKSLPNHRILSAAEVLAAEPGLRAAGLQGGAAYHDARVDLPERLCLENVLDARERGALAFNYAEAVAAIRERGRITGLRLRDVLDGSEAEVHGRLVINATGPWLDHVAGRLTPGAHRRLSTSKGIHIVCPPISRGAVVLFSRLDGRIIFVIPRAGSSWIGTTDTAFTGDPGDARATHPDVRYLVESVREAFPGTASDHVFFTTAGVRALVRDERHPYAISRMHRIIDEAVDGAEGLISVLGGKITGYRAIAEETTDLACRKLGLRRPCRTARMPLPGARPAAGASADGAELPAGVVTHLEAIYGSRARGPIELAAADPCLRAPLSTEQPDIGAQAVFAVRAEQCLRVADFMLRRTLLGAGRDRGWQAAPAVAALMAPELGWSAGRQAAELEEYRRCIEQAQPVPEAGS